MVGGGGLPALRRWTPSTLPLTSGRKVNRTPLWGSAGTLEPSEICKPILDTRELIIYEFIVVYGNRLGYIQEGLACASQPVARV